jgi:2-oxoglutarate dehydrogenase complex dehydrogenase (E1) component-like enzyme
VVHDQIHLGIAVDVPGKATARNLMVPNIKNAGALDFQAYLAAYDDLVARARAGRLTPDDFEGTTISLTNPGTVGTTASSPRLMAGQGAIIATGAIEYPAVFQGAAPETSALLGLSKVMTLTCAYDHRVIQMINAYRVRGHLIADLDPLGHEPGYHPEMDPETYGLTIWDLDREFHTGSLADAKPAATLREILETLRRTYCGKLGCEYMNIQVPEQKRWLQQRMEPRANHWPLDREARLRTLGALVAAAGGVHEVVMGMAHRGRLNVLANVVGKPLTQIFSEFEGALDPASTQGSGDVKYHLGAHGVRRFPGGREVAVSVSPNPSHLEAVDPMVEGIVRPRQDRLGDTERARDSGARPRRRGLCRPGRGGRDAGLRHAGDRGHARAPERAGFRPRHVQPAPPGVLRFRRRPPLHAAATHRPRPGALRRQ